MAKLSLGVMLLLGMLLFLAHRSYASFEEAAKESIRKQLSNDFNGRIHLSRIDLCPGEGNDSWVDCKFSAIIFTNSATAIASGHCNFQLEVKRRYLMNGECSFEKRVSDRQWILQAIRIRNIIPQEPRSASSGKGAYGASQANWLRWAQ